MNREDIKVGQVYQYKYADRNGVYFQSKVIDVIQDSYYIKAINPIVVLEDMVHPDVYGYNYGPSYQITSQVPFCDFWVYELVEDVK
jgi:hypothetical protein